MCVCKHAGFVSVCGHTDFFCVHVGVNIGFFCVLVGMASRLYLYAWVCACRGRHPRFMLVRAYRFYQCMSVGVICQLYQFVCSCKH